MLFRFLLAVCLPAILGGATFAIRDVTVIDGTGAPPRPHSTIVVRGDRILSIGPMDKTVIPKGARVIGGRGRFIIPGLWDMHVHLWDAENVLPMYVAYGVTGVRDMGSDFKRTSKWRSAIESGQAIGPHVMTSGPPMSGTPSEDPKLPVQVVKTPDEARKTYDELDDYPVDFIKVLTSVPRDAFFAMAERARHWGTAFAGHVPAGVTFSEAIEARMNSIEHLFGVFAACSSEEANIRSGKTPAARMLETFDENKARDLFKRSALMATRQVPSFTLWERMA
jgi:hypothetical protein